MWRSDLSSHVYSTQTTESALMRGKHSTLTPGRVSTDSRVGRAPPTSEVRVSTDSPGLGRDVVRLNALKPLYKFQLPRIVCLAGSVVRATD